MWTSCSSPLGSLFRGELRFLSLRSYDCGSVALASAVSIPGLQPCGGIRGSKLWIVFVREDFVLHTDKFSILCRSFFRPLGIAVALAAELQ